MKQCHIIHIVSRIYVCIGMLAINLAAEVIHVPSHYSTIQEGLNAAQAGDTVLVAAGTYPENITWPALDGITLLSETGPSTTTIDGAGVDRVIKFPNFAFSRSTVISGFSIQNGKAIQGAGLFIYGSPYIINNVIQRNIAIDTSGWIYGGGMFCYGDGSPLIEANTIRCNVTQGPDWNFGAGLYVDNDAVILGNIIEHDSAIGGGWNYGAGIYCGMQANPQIHHNIILNNVSCQGTRGYGAGIFVDLNCGAYILSNLIYNNTAQSDIWNSGGGIYLYSGATVVNNTIVDNTCAGGTQNRGGGIYISDSTHTISNNIIVNNSALDGGAGVFAYTNGHATLLNNNVWNNTGGNYSGITPGTSDISSDPLFVTGALGDFYLSQTAAGQGYDSPCIDYGYTSAINLGLDTLTTRTDSVYDTGTADLGYHYPIEPFVYINEHTEYYVATSQYAKFQVFPTISSSFYRILLVFSSPQYVELYVYDALGCRRHTLHKGVLESGQNELTWKRSDMKEHNLQGGIYFIVAEIGHTKQFSKKVILVE